MSAALHAVIPAAGIGSRMGGETPKQYLLLNGSTLLERSVGVLLQVPAIQTVTLALHPEDTVAHGLDLLADTRVNTVTGGVERADSVLLALRAVPGEPDDWVLVHDAARPCLALQDLQRLIAQVLATGEGGILAQPIVDTVKQADAQGRAQQTLDRRLLWRAQTPQMFRLGQLTLALEQAAAAGVVITDEASAMERLGYPVQLVQGGAGNLKITVPQDLPLARWYLSQMGRDC